VSELRRRLREVSQAEGLPGVARHAVGRLRRAAYLHERHTWYELLLDGDLPERPLPEGYELVRATEADLALAAQTGKEPEHTRRTLADGHELWLVRDADSGAFSCWVYHGRAPVLAASGGWLALPDRTVCLEDSETSPDHRGRGIAPAAWLAIARALGEGGYDTMITKVDVENAPSRRACEKAGFEEVGVMDLRRLGPRRRVEVTEPVGRSGPALAAALARAGKNA